MKMHQLNSQTSLRIIYQFAIFLLVAKCGHSWRDLRDAHGIFKSILFCCRGPDHHRFSKVLNLKQELESKFQSWRKQVLEVQMKSLEMAENRARLFLNQRSLRVRSETRTRRAKHEALLKKVEENEDSRKNATLQHLSARMSLFDQWQIKRKQEHHDIMQKVQKAANLRQAILWDKKLQIEMRFYFNIFLFLFSGLWHPKKCKNHRHCN